MSGFNGLGMHLGNLSRLSRAKTRSISPENPTGGKGQAAMATEGTGAEAARDLGRGWKISPSIRIAPGETATIAARLKERKGHFMPPSLLDSQFATLEPPGADEPGIVRVSIDPPVDAVVATALDGIAAARR